MCCDPKFEDYLKASYPECKEKKFNKVVDAAGVETMVLDTTPCVSYWNTSADLNLYIKYTHGQMPAKPLTEKTVITPAGQAGKPQTECDIASDKSKMKCVVAFRNDHNAGLP